MPRRPFIIHQNVERTLPNGKKSVLTYIEHPGAVIIAPMLDANTVLMIKQFRVPLNKSIYELPAGTIDVPEKPSVTVRRELIEETGYRAKKITRLGMIYPVPGYSNEIIYMFKAEGLIFGKAQPEDYEIIKLIPMSKQKVKSLFDGGQIKDAKTICTLAKLKWLG